MFRYVRTMLPSFSIKINRLTSVAPFVIMIVFGVANYSGSTATPDSSVFGSDSLITLSRALAGLYPNLYAKDFLFSDPTNYRFYNNANVGFFQLAELFHFHRFAEAYRFLDGIVLVVFLLGYYLLGLKVIQNRFAAFVFAFSSVVPISTLGGDYWGIYSEPQARLLFSAALPFCVLLGVDRGERLIDWLAMFLCLGLVLWLHPASGPPVALALMIAMAIKSYRRDSFRKVLGFSIVSGLLFLGISGANLWQYYSIVRQASAGADPTLAEQAVKVTYNLEYVEGADGLSSSMSHIFAGMRLGLAVLGLLGFIVAFKFGKLRDRSNLAFLTTALISIFILAGVVPMAESALARVMDRPPMQFDLIRSTRYIVPLLLLLSIWGGARLPLPAAARFVVVLSIGIFWFHARLSPPSPDYLKDLNVLRGLQCWRHAQLICPRPNDSDVTDMLEFVETKTPADGLFFSPVSGLVIRSIARRPLAFEIKDAGWLAYSNHVKLIDNIGLIKDYKNIVSQPISVETNKHWLSFAQRTAANYVVLQGSVEPEAIPATDSLVFKNRSFSVFRQTSSKP